MRKIEFRIVEEHGYNDATENRNGRQIVGQEMENGIMSRTLPFDAARCHLREIVEGMIPGEELILTAQGEPLAVVTRPPRNSWPCPAGFGQEYEPLDRPGL